MDLTLPPQPSSQRVGEMGVDEDKEKETGKDQQRPQQNTLHPRPGADGEKQPHNKPGREARKREPGKALAGRGAIRNPTVVDLYLTVTEVKRKNKQDLRCRTCDHCTTVVLCSSANSTL